LNSLHSGNQGGNFVLMNFSVVIDNEKVAAVFIGAFVESGYYL